MYSHESDCNTYRILRLYFHLIMDLSAIYLIIFYFFFQAEDGIRDKLVTGVQTCALPISVLDVKDANMITQIGIFKIYPAQFVSIGLIILLTYINTRGIKEGKLIQTSFTIVKLLSLFGLIVFGLLIAAKTDVWNANWADAWSMTSRNAEGQVVGGVVGSAVLGAIAASMVGSIFSSDAWNNVTFIAGEVKNPKRNIGLSLFLGTLIVTLIYITANLMYLQVLPLDGIAYPQADRLAISAANQIFGIGGKEIIAVLIMVSTFGCNNGLILAGARVYYTMALDGLFFKKAGMLNKNSVPQWALWSQAVVASLLCL